MKMRDLIRYVEPTTTAPAWPPCWIGSFALVDPTPMPGTAVLESLARVGVGRQLSIDIRFEKRKYVGLLSWDGPPSLPAVERLLQAHIGRGIGVIGELDV
jgi:hypothetical protein